MMNTREEIRKVTVDAKIYDLGLAEMVKNALEGEAAFSEEKVYFGLDVVFDKSVYREAAFYQYPVSKEAKGPKPKTERE